MIQVSSSALKFILLILFTVDENTPNKQIEIDIGI